ncbi:replication-associated recombination protein A [Helicobacter mustelae]|uniref:Replication-associated recombination protein A n=1 Tax=Helicobacter mustelae (strain ATCC 43772 / CCUG 25715 / CIP 103759 / LMG 18044 / NCTC 12198 / R85-136P) TaxID=679897 RepID=D3UI45_HELM1|nr:replication-associated recombination protein A [Helicobacter mustelae]CBG40168.1 helicase-like protein [Helicobacter mustelae 12198]SQH71670.1 helicase-like protein [Helicobacter mustelae]STP12795.1 helicase-like protein [Helicobacter mustelae]
MRNLASLLRPKSFKDFVGQEHLFSKDSVFSRVLESGHFPHSFFYGPPGVGKTTLARIVAKELEMPFLEFNGVDFALESLRCALKEYKNTLIKPVVFIDEVHRLSKNQQEFLLPVMENHQAIILGASTQNPFSILTNALRSRSILLELHPLKSHHLREILQKALDLYPCKITSDARVYLMDSSNGDARAMLHLLDIAMQADEITLPLLKSIRPFRLGEGSSEQDTHYHLASAMIKSIRGSDVDASIYYLARLIASGENPEFIARRLVILASEDIGNANPNALNLAVSTLNAVAKIGYPESRIILSQCVIYLASSPKSNTAYKAINLALDYVKNHAPLPIPPNILPHAKDYLYPHDFGGYVKQNYLHESLEFVQESRCGFEKTLQEWLCKIKQEKK